jgi:hypothetical protein
VSRLRSFLILIDSSQKILAFGASQHHSTILSGGAR